MGFLDNFKAAMKAGAEAGNASIERLRAEKAAEESAAHPRPQARPQARPQQSRLPEGVIMVSLNDMEPVALGMNSAGQNVALSVSGALLAKPDGGTSLDAASQRNEIREITAEIIRRELTPRIDSMGDLKSLMMAANNLNKVICEELKAHGYTAGMKMPLILHPVGG